MITRKVARQRFRGACETNIVRKGIDMLFDRPHIFAVCTLHVASGFIALRHLQGSLGRGVKIPRFEARVRERKQSIADIAIPPILAIDAAMIIVVEGISASGKSTWCRKQGLHQIVPENGRVVNVPDRSADPLTVAGFWSDRNTERWRSALAVERKTGVAICDTDPLKLHYRWCLWQIGAASEDDWRHELAATRRSFGEKKIGFAGAYFVKEIDPALARQQRDGDTTRSRRNFELHVRLQAPLITWYKALDAVLPQGVQFSFPDRWMIPPHAGLPSSVRYDMALFDRAMAMLPAPSSF